MLANHHVTKAVLLAQVTASSSPASPFAFNVVFQRAQTQPTQAWSQLLPESAGYHCEPGLRSDFAAHDVACRRFVATGAELNRRR